MIRSLCLRSVVLLGCLSFAAACGDDDDDGGGLDDFLPDLPAPTGEPQSVFAGEITSADDLIDGPARSGMIGDFFLRNSRARFVIQSPARVIGVVPQGGNLVDAVPLGPDGEPLAEDHFGELSSIYLVGRTCEHETVEVVRDGSEGGVAVIRARGRSAVNDFINIQGMGVLSIPVEIDPDIEDEVECATTYILEPDSPTLHVHWTFFNAGDIEIIGPFGSLNDTGGVTESFSPTRGFERFGIEALTTLAEPAPVPYVVYQGPDVAYGVIPRHDDANVPNSAFIIAGVSIVLYGSDKLLDILRQEAWFFRLPAGDGVNHRIDVVVGRDAAAIEEEFQRSAGNAVAEVSGTVAFAGGAVPTGARVGLFEDTNGSGDLDDEDRVISYFDADAEGAFSGRVAPGNYLLRAEVKDVARSEAMQLTLAAAGASDLAFTLPDPVVLDYTITDDETGNAIPGRVMVLGTHAAFPDKRLFETADRLPNVVRMIPAARGTTIDVGDGADPQLVLPVGGPYKVFASRGTEWSVDAIVIDPATTAPPAQLDFTLRRVADTPGYLSTEFHQHSVGSPDSPVPRDVRLFTFAAEGIEFFASTDHDYVTDFQPLIEALGLQTLMRAIPGLEVTPFVYGHFQAYPIAVSDQDASGGAIDWARGTAGFAMIPGEVFDAARDRGAEVVQINHPRARNNDAIDMQQYFDRAGLFFDYDNRVVDGDPLLAPVPNEWMTLPEATISDDSFNALEVWNGFGMKDSNEDGVREISKLDIVMRDWFNFLSFGMKVTPVGNSDTHTVVSDPPGMPRTLVRVPDDSALALQSDAIVDDVMDTLAGRNGTPVDVVVTNGPHLTVEVDGFDGSPLGREVTATGGTVTLRVSVVAADWAPFDTLEVFANATPEREKDETWLQPLVCLTSRELGSLADADPCKLAPNAPGALTVTLEDVPEAPGFRRYVAEAEISIDATDIAMVNRAGATGTDAWLVIRVRGDRAIFPILTSDLGDVDLGVLLGTDEEAIEAELTGTGVPATAFTAPIYVDFDGGGYTAPFAP